MTNTAFNIFASIKEINRVHCHLLHEQPWTYTALCLVSLTRQYCSFTRPY